MKSALPLFLFLRDAVRNGERTALVTITGVIGGSSRAPGTHLAVSGSGAWHGALSGGCVEAAVVAEALRIIAAGTVETIRFGEGSRFIDIRLPCGGGMDLMFVPGPTLELLDKICNALRARRSVTLRLGPGLSPCTIAENDTATGWVGPSFHARHDPDLQVVVIGHGAEAIAMARQAMAYGADVIVLSPDKAVLGATTQIGARTIWLKTLTQSIDLVLDPFSAVVMLFHDHDWEANFLMQILEQGCFYVGAMGSRATQAARLDQMAARGASKTDLARIVGPAGLIPTSRDPDTHALSILAEIVARAPQYNEGRSLRRASLRPMADLAYLV